jgi:alcohol dehydrogenase class IV
VSDFFQLVPRIHYGAGAAVAAGPALRELGVRQPLVVCDPGVVSAGACDPVLASLKDAGIAYTLFTDVRTNPSERNVHAAATAYADAECDGMVGVGGGSAMDVAKSAVTVLAGGGDIAEYEDGARVVTGPYPPLLLAPTTAGTGSEAVAGAIITDSRRVFKMHIVAVPAHVAICDPELTHSLPAGPTAASGIDALAHAIGAYVSVERQPLADGMALYAISTIVRALPRVVADGGDRAARADMMVGSLSAGISMKGGGAVDHAFAHAVNAIFDVHHGAGVAMFLADGMEFNLPHLPERFADIARALGVTAVESDPARLGLAGIGVVRRLVADLPLPRPADAGITARHVPELTAKVLSDGFHLGLNPVPLGAADAERILRTVIQRETR